MLDDPGRDFRLIVGETEDDCRRSIRAERQRPRQLRAHQRRGVVKQHDERALGSGTIIRPEIGIKIGAR